MWYNIFMSKNKGNKIFFIVVLSLLGTFVLLTALTFVLRLYFAEWWTRTISRGLRIAASTITNILPFSLTEILIYIVILLAIAIIVMLIVLLVKKRGKATLKLFSLTVTVVMFFVMMYSMSASAEYKRQSLTGEWQNATASKEEFLQIAKQYQVEYNALAEGFERDEAGNIVEKYTFEETALLVKQEVEKYADGDYFSSTVATPKQVASSELMSYLGISGMYLSLTGEANINTVTHYIDLPFIMAHELSHSLQIMRENEANIFAFYVCLGSQNPYLRYSALAYGYYHLVNGIATLYGTSSQTYDEYVSSLSSLAQQDNFAANNVWSKYQTSFISSIGDFFNDLYLKLSGIAEGTGSYQVPGATLTPKPPSIPGEVIVMEVSYSPIQKIFIHLYDPWTTY